MTNTIHLYRQRHIFFGDDPIGKYHVPTRTARLSPDFAQHGQAVKAYYLRHFGVIARILVGDEAPAPEPQLREFPDHIRALAGPAGDRTPEVIQYARDHFTAAEFLLRYGTLPDGTKPDAETAVPAGDATAFLNKPNPAPALSPGAGKKKAASGPRRPRS